MRQWCEKKSRTAVQEKLQPAVLSLVGTKKLKTKTSSKKSISLPKEKIFISAKMFVCFHWRISGNCSTLFLRSKIFSEIMILKISMKQNRKDLFSFQKNADSCCCSSTC